MFKSRNPVPSPLLASIALHVVIVGVFVLAIIDPRPYQFLFGKAPSAPVRAERIGFLRLPQPGSENVVSKDGGDGTPATKPKQKKELIAPLSIPTGIPALPDSKKTNESQEGTGPLMGGGGITRGIRPAYKDPRLWAPPSVVVTAPKSTPQFVDSLIAADVNAYNDSIVAMGAQKAPGDWTVEKNGKKYGIDSKYIRLGPVSIPTSVLALLPLNVQANPQVTSRERIQNAMRADIMYHAQLGMNEAQFRKAVKAIRERKERERAEAVKVNSKTANPTQAPGAVSDSQ